MGRAGLFILAFILGFLAVSGYAQGADKDADIPPGMEIIKVGGANVVVPAGTKVYKHKGLITIESINQYTARRLLETEERLGKLEATQEKLKEKIEKLRQELKKIVDDAQKNEPPS